MTIVIIVSIMLNFFFCSLHIWFSVWYCDERVLKQNSKIGIKIEEICYRYIEMEAGVGHIEIVKVNLHLNKRQRATER